MSLSVVVPCFNEVKNLPALLERFLAIYRNGVFELVLVDNGSTDNTREFLRSLLKEKYPFFRMVVVEKNVGYGHGILAGLKEASGEVLAWTHADLQTDPEDVLRSYGLFLKSEGKRVVKGRRSGRGLFDWFFTAGMSITASLVFGKKLNDINAQPKLFGRDFYELMKNPPLDFSLDLYWMCLAKSRGYEILEIPVVFGKRVSGESKSAPNLRGKLKTARRTLSYIFRLRKVLT